MRFLRIIGLPGMVLAIVWVAPAARGLDNIAGKDYGQIGPVMYYDPNTGQSRPFLPIGWYFFWPTDNHLLDEIAASGSNTVLFADVQGVADGSNGLFVAAQLGFDKAHALGLKVVLGFDFETFIGVDRDDVFSYLHFLGWINEFKNHPALLGWQLGDENGLGGPYTLQNLINTAWVFEQFDPHHQIWQVFAPGGQPDQELIDLMTGSDVATFDGYFTFDATPTFGGKSRGQKNHRAGLCVDNGWASNLNVEQGVGNDVGIFDIYRFPTYEEYRYLVFSSFAGSGVRGTLNWIYYYEVPNQGGWYSDNDLFLDWVNGPQKLVNLEQQMIAHAMETGWNVGNVSASTDGQLLSDNSGLYNKVSHLLTYDDLDEVYYFIVTHNDAGSVNVDFTLTQMPDPVSNLTAEVPEDASFVILQNPSAGTFVLSDTLGNHQVKIYKIFADGAPTACGELGTVYFEADLDSDCYVKNSDFSLFADQWGQCSDPENAACDPFWNKQPVTQLVRIDDFASYAAGTNLHTQPDWVQAHGALFSEEIQAGWSGVVITDSFDAANGATNGGPATGQAFVKDGEPGPHEADERIAVDFMWEDPLVTPNPNNLKCGVTLNYDQASAWGGNILDSAAYIAETNGLFFGFWKRSQSGPNTDLYFNGWVTINPPLAQGQWYTLEIKKYDWQMTATVYRKSDGAVLAQSTYFDDGSTYGPRFTGGYPTFYTAQAPAPGWAVPQRDNFIYERGVDPNPAFCGAAGTEYLVSDFDKNCYVDIDDWLTLASRWLWCSDPANAACDGFWN